MKLIIFISFLVACANAFSISPITTSRIAITKKSSSQLNGFESEALASMLAELEVAQETLLAAGAAAIAGIGAIGAMVSGQNKNNAKTTTAQKATIIEPKFDVSIPYDAAALLAFNEWKGDLKYDETVFNKFKILYVEKAVAEVIQKRVARELEEVSKKADDNLSNLLKEVNANFAFSEKKK